MFCILRTDIPPPPKYDDPPHSPSPLTVATDSIAGEDVTTHVIGDELEDEDRINGGDREAEQGGLGQEHDEHAPPVPSPIIRDAGVEDGVSVWRA